MRNLLLKLQDCCDLDSVTVSEHFMDGKHTLFNHHAGMFVVLLSGK